MKTESIIDTSREIHVAVTGSDSAPGSAGQPVRTIGRAAALAAPGDVVVIHAGTYRERIDPPCGGNSDGERITFQAAPGESVEIKGSEVAGNWQLVQGEVWKTDLSNSIFGDFNPFNDLIRGDWFTPKGRKHHTGAVYLDGAWISEAANLDEVFHSTQPGLLWWAEVTEAQTTIWSRFGNAAPNASLVEINVRQSLFYPSRTRINYITVRGLKMRHAATQWAPPTAEQIGLIGTNWSRGWIIENNEISHSMCCGVTLGKYGDEWDNSSADTAEGYNETIARAILNGWDRDNVGSHIVRGNEISHCEQAGIVGSLGAIFSSITGNHLHHIWCKQQFNGAEMAGIKIHAAIDTLIKGNRIHASGRGIWLDWMAQGARVTGNLLYDNCVDDLFMEVNHGPCLVDNNLFLSGVSVRDWSQGTAYAHNWFSGAFSIAAQDRRTPFHVPHSTQILGFCDIRKLDSRFFNNIFVGTWSNSHSDLQSTCHGLWGYEQAKGQIQAGGNLYYDGARPDARENGSTEMLGVDPLIQLVETDGRVQLSFQLGAIPASHVSRPVTTSLLGLAGIPQLPYVNPDGSGLSVDTDFLGSQRNRTAPRPGPFESASPNNFSIFMTLSDQTTTTTATQATSTRFSGMGGKPGFDP